MNVTDSFTTFLQNFFDIFAGKSFYGGDYLAYLKKSAKEREGDEAAIVDMAIMSPLLGLLGFAPAERVYNRQKADNRPDFAPLDALYGTCFMVEDKSTALALDVNLTNPDGHLSQLVRYMRGANVHSGLLTNGIQLTAWRLNASGQVECVFDIDLPATIARWRMAGSDAFPRTYEKSLQDLFDLFRKQSFTDPGRLEREIATDLDEWIAQALPLSSKSGNQSTLVETLQVLVKDLQRDARRILEEYLIQYEEYSQRAQRIYDDDLTLAAQQFKQMREAIGEVLAGQLSSVWGLSEEQRAAILDILIDLERDARLFSSPREVEQRILALINEARKRKYKDKPRLARRLESLGEFSALQDRLKSYIDKSFLWHQRQAALRHDFREALRIYDDYTTWKALVQETMLGELDEERRRDEFALQSAYVVFIRLLLIRICEDKGVFPHRFLSDGGLKHWQEDIERYFIFARGNPYSPLLDIAYRNAQNIYSHFFTGRELFNWYQLDKKRFILTLYQLGRFNFAEVDSDIIGTIYSTYVNREEKRNKGQYYTPSEIIHYILDNVGYTGTNMVGSQKRLIDPACGSGSFLVTAARRLIAAYRGAKEQIDDPEAVLDRVQQSLFGFDLNPFACYLAEMNLLIQVLDLVKQALAVKKDLHLKPFHIYNVDALTRPSGIYYYMNFNTLLAEENDEVNQIKNRAEDSPYAQGFTFVVANPPYGATLSESYKRMLRENWSDIFYGQPDTYTFFLKLGLELLAKNGRLGFITPNTYLMGKNTAMLRSKLLNAGRIEQIVDLPQGIWADATVDCVLLFLAAESNEERRLAQQIQVNVLGMQDRLDKLASHLWEEQLIQSQGSWLVDSDHKMDIRRNQLIHQIENVCRVPVNGGPSTKIQRLGDLTESSQGIIVYGTSEESLVNPYIKSRREVPSSEISWKPVLDGDSSIGRYSLQWSKTQPYLKYGSWLHRPREAKYFEQPKILLVRLRNKSLSRRLIATYDDTGFVNRDNFNNIIAKGTQYKLKYILAIINSSLLNYWYRRSFDNVNINPDYFRQIPIYPADSTTQDLFVGLVDKMLSRHAELNEFRAQGYIIQAQKKYVRVPYEVLLRELRTTRQDVPVFTLYDAQAVGLFSIPANCDLSVTVSKNVFNPTKYPNTIVLRHNKLWFEVPDERWRGYLLNYLQSPQWQGKTWDNLKDTAFVPGDENALEELFTLEQQKRKRILALLNEIQQIDIEIDNRVLDLYGITDLVDRQRVLGSAPLEEEEPTAESGIEIGDQE